MYNLAYVEPEDFDELETPDVQETIKDILAAQTPSEYRQMTGFAVD